MNLDELTKKEIEKLKIILEKSISILETDLDKNQIYHKTLSQEKEILKKIQIKYPEIFI